MNQKLFEILPWWLALILSLLGIIIWKLLEQTLNLLSQKLAGWVDKNLISEHNKINNLILAIPKLLIQILILAALLYFVAWLASEAPRDEYRFKNGVIERALPDGDIISWNPKLGDHAPEELNNKK